MKLSGYLLPIYFVVVNVFGFDCAYGEKNEPVFYQQRCIYTDDLGIIREISGDAPAEFATSAKCFQVKTTPLSERGVTKKSDSQLPSNHEAQVVNRANSMASPDQIDLDGNLRKARISSSLGTVQLRWPRSAEKWLGKSPERATADAARMASRALLQSGFPSKYNRFNLDWNIVFMDQDVPINQVPMQLVTNCHPAWMTPPANIYLVVQRVAAGCNNQSREDLPKEKVDAEVARVLAHEMGHVIEAEILGEAFVGDRMRAEGFATWFETVASDYSQIIKRGEVLADKKALATKSFLQSPDRFNFSGSGQDYARASMYFQAVVKDRGVKGLMRVYDRIKKAKHTPLTFIDAVTAEFGWSIATIEKKAQAMAK